MSWTQVSPARFERPFDSIEWFYRALLPPPTDGKNYREFWLITTVAKIKLEREQTDIVSALKDAWCATRYDHPELACKAGGHTKVYEMLKTEEEVLQWLSETFIILPDSTAHDLLAIPKPYDICICYWLPKSSEIALVASHWRIDGVGCLQLLNNLLKALVEDRKPLFGAEGKNLSENFYKAAGISTDHVSPETDRQAAARLATLTDNFPSIGLPLRLDDDSHSTRRIERRLSLQSTASVRSACKAHGISLTAAIHAALAVSIHKIARTSALGLTAGARKYVSWCVFDLRPYTKPPTTSPTNPVTNYHGAIPSAQDPTAAFLTNAKDLTEVYKKRWDEPYLAAENSGTGHDVAPTLLQSLHPFLEKVTDLFLQPMPPDAPEATQPTFSSLGQIERYVSPKYKSESAGGASVLVDDFWLGLEVAAGEKQPVVHLWIWQDKVCIAVCYDQAFFGEDVMAQLLEGMFKVLGQELNIELEQDPS